MAYFGDGYRAEQRVRAGKYIGITIAIVGGIIWGLVALISQPYCTTYEHHGYRYCTQQISPFETVRWTEDLEGNRR